jgi:hypothetical protein
MNRGWGAEWDLFLYVEVLRVVENEEVGFKGMKICV